MFENTLPGPPDPMFTLKQQADADLSVNKVDLGVGVYRNEQAAYHELEVIRRAKVILHEINPGHDYESTMGNTRFLIHAACLVFGESSPAIRNKKVASVQTISGTGANHLAALFLSRSKEFSDKTVYIGVPAWGNYDPIFRLVGLRVANYNYYDIQQGVDFLGMIKTVEAASPRSIFVLQSCCHNPTGADLTKQQWKRLAELFKAKEILAFFDTAYQGLGTGFDEDSYGIQHFVESGLELVVAQSFSKNFGLYGERVGVLHIVAKANAYAQNIRDQLRSLIRWEFSSSPSYGSRLVSIVLDDAELSTMWKAELAIMRQRLVDNRQKLYQAVVNKLKTTGDWTSITSTQGLFCYLPLSPHQCVLLRDKHHIHLPENGRINIAGLNKSNLEYIANSIHDVVG